MHTISGQAYIRKCKFKYRVLLMLFSACISLNVYAGKTDLKKGVRAKAFSALQVSFESTLPEKIAKSRVYSSRDGMRIEGISDPDSATPKLVFLFRAQDGANIIIDPVQKAFVVMGTTKGVKVEDNIGSVLAPEPCYQFNNAKKTGIVDFYKRRVEKWLCQHPSMKLNVMQLYDPEFGIVVKEDNAGKITELRDIKPIKSDKRLFNPPKTYKKMSLLEIMTGYVELGRYKDD